MTNEKKEFDVFFVTAIFPIGSSGQFSNPNKRQDFKFGFSKRNTIFPFSVSVLLCWSLLNQTTWIAMPGTEITLDFRLQYHSPCGYRCLWSVTIYLVVTHLVLVTDSGIHAHLVQQSKHKRHYKWTDKRRYNWIHLMWVISPSIDSRMRRSHSSIK